jgi:menaquinone-dependent protoporphyrinogen oxidase
MRIAILYATREGQTRRIAEYLAGAFQARDVFVDLYDLKETPEPDVGRYDALVLAASVHIGSYEPEMVRFVKRHRDNLSHAAFVSVSMSAAGVGDVQRTPEQRQAAQRELDTVLQRFVKRTGWQPLHVQQVAGALLYTKYNFLVRFVMKQISKAAGGSTDTTRDHEYTDWAGLERFASQITGELRTPEAEAGQTVSP